jgi:hypothetical protein
MTHIRLYREGGRYMESAGKKEQEKKKKRRNTIADEHASTLGLQESIE